jgi:hypothetical protein
MMSDEPDRFGEALNEGIDGGGCTEAWKMTQQYREQHNQTDNRSSDNYSRRRILKSIGGLTTAGGALITSGSTEAKAQTSREELLPEIPEVETITDAHAERIVGQYENTATVRRAIETHASGVLDELARLDHIPSADMNGLPVDTVQTGQSVIDPSRSVDATKVTATRINGVETGMISVSLSDPSLSLFVQPELDRSYAVIDGMETPTVVTNTADSYDCNDHCTTCWSECGGFCLSFRLGIGNLRKDYIHIDCTDFNPDCTYRPCRTFRRLTGGCGCGRGRDY